MLSFPLRLDAAGSAVTIDDNSRRAAAELTGHVVSCVQGERPLGPGYGLPDPVTAGVDPSGIAAAVSLCEPEIDVTNITVTDVSVGRARIRMDVEWSQA